MAPVAAGIHGLSGTLRLPAGLGPLVLASASPRRAALLAAAGLAFERVPAGVDESLHPGETPPAAVLRLARAKAAAVAAGRRTGGVLAGDTLVAVEGLALGQPADAAAARAMLRRLSGREHEVHSAVALLRLRDGRMASGVASARVACAPLDAATLAEYLASGEWEGKAGAYAIQGRAGRFMRVVAGDTETVIGLSLALVARLLDELDEDACP